MYDIIIIGAGTAGLTAAIYACRAGKKVLVLEGKSYGGQIINTPDIENYPAEPHISGFDFATKLFEQAKALGAETVFRRVTGIRDEGGTKTVITRRQEYACKAVIIATGSETRKLGLPNEEELVGRGVSYCATCDGNFFAGKTVAVVGGGNTALEDALYLSDIANKVYLIHRRDSFRGENAAVEKIRSKANVELVLNSKVTGIIAEERVKAIEVTGNSGKTEEIAVNGLFVAVGRVPDNSAFSPPVTLDEAGYIPAGEDCRTNVPGIFAAGDVRAKALRQLVTAASDGAIAAFGAINYIS
ncbi:MAG: thioredoxin-disulfide reductase [Clostridia bacterium]|nr:thioredoxin-disulfide reductase [Clostridia bacterium]